MATTLSGDLIEPLYVENPLNDPDATEDPRTETYIGGTKGDIEIERDPEVTDWYEHMNEYQQSRELQDTGELSVEFALKTDFSYLLDAQLFYEDTENGIYRPNKNLILEAIEFDVYESADDADPATTYRCFQVRPQIETTFSAPIDDIITLEATYDLMGPHGPVIPPA